MKSGRLRDSILICCMLGAFALVMANPARKQNAADKINLATFIPESFAGWVSRTYDTSDYKDKWQSINEVLVRSYAREVAPGVYARLNFVLEYSSDLRKNFSFHFPETCHRAGGNDIEFLKPLNIELEPGRSITAKVLFIKGKAGASEANDKIVVYWLVIDKKQYFQTFFIKLDQMLAGLLRRSKSGFLIRFDYSDALAYDSAGLERAYGVVSGFVSDLYGQLGQEERELFFGRSEKEKG